jgi:hypothetical protein
LETSPLIQSLWIGDALSPMEELCFRSFVAAGHPVDLYVYGDVRNVPAGVRLRDASEILPASRIFRYREHDSVAGFANFFRYKLLLERGGWWVDADMVCLRPFAFVSEYVFASEITYRRPLITNCVMHVPPGSVMMQRAVAVCDATDPATIRWGETGPRLCTQLVAELGLQSYVLPPEVFCPVEWANWRVLADPAARLRLPGTAYAVHLWNEMWRRGGADKHTIDADQLFARLRTAAGR